MSKSYLYIGSLYDKLGREVGIFDKKIGITKTPKRREDSLNKTKSPIGVVFDKIYELNGEKTAHIIEQGILHNLLSDRNTEGEWYRDDDSTVIESVERALSSFKQLGIDINEVKNDCSDFTPSEKKQIERNKVTNLHVIFDKKHYKNETAKKTYINVLRDIGLEKCMNVLGEKYITTIEDNDMRHSTPVDGYYIEANNSTSRKADLIEKIKEALNLDLECNII